MTTILSCQCGRFVCTCGPVYLQTPLFDFVLGMQQRGKYRCGCGVLISNVGKAECEHYKSDRHPKWLKSQQTTKTLSAFFVREQNPVGSSNSSSSSSSITNTSNNYNTNSSSSSANCSSNIGSGSSSSVAVVIPLVHPQLHAPLRPHLQLGLGSRSAPGERLNPPPAPSNVYKGQGGLGGWLGLGWVVPQNPKIPQPLMNEVCALPPIFALFCVSPITPQQCALCPKRIVTLCA